MDCYVYFPQVEVYYWPVPESEATCANESKPLVTSQAVLPTGAARTAEARYNALYSNSSLTGPVSTVNADGFTFVSPSVYVAFGDVSAGDACGAVGQKYTSVTLGFAPGVLQTVTCKISPMLGFQVRLTISSSWTRSLQHSTRYSSVRSQKRALST